ncbi:MAG: glycosyltransferase family 4 protein [Coxiellaceae bacterium]|nr:glycosyltransferase family 4 protein [Coxiellaceae bacterium]
MKKLKVLQLLPALNAGGVERGTVDLARFLKAHGIGNAVLSTGGQLEAELKKASVDHMYFPSKSKNPLTFCNRVKKLKALLHTQQPALLHARSRIPAWLTYFANKSLQLPLIITCHGLHDSGFLGLKRFYNAGLVKGDRIIAVSETVKDYLVKNFPDAQSKIVVIPRGIDSDYFSPIKKHQTPKLRIILPGRITAWKGHLYCLKAFSKVIHDYKIGAELIIVGKTKRNCNLTQLKKSIQKLDIENHVQFLGNSNKMPEIYASGDLVISSSIEPESFGRVAVEAMAMEKLVIATNIGGSRETIVHGKTGWLVKPNDVDAMAKAIHHALTLSSEERILIEKNARAHVLKHFTLAQMMEKTLAVYTSLLQNPLNKF